MSLRDELEKKYPSLIGSITSGEIGHCDHCGSLWVVSHMTHRCIGMVEAELAAERKRIAFLIGEDGRNYCTKLENDRKEALASLAAMTKRAEKAQHDLDGERGLVNRLRGDLAAMTERAEKAETANAAFLSINKMHAENGRFEVSLDTSQAFICRMCDIMKPLLKDSKNYTECTLSNGVGDRYIVRIQRSDGKTPHQLREAAEAERDAATAEVERLRGLIRALVRPTTDELIAGQGDITAVVTPQGENPGGG